MPAAKEMPSLSLLPGPPGPGASRTCLVIGSGVAGLQVAHQLQKIQYQVLVLEGSSNIGGVWSQNYVGYGLQVPWHSYQFPEFPWPKELQPSEEYPSGQQVQRYIRAYAERFGLLPYIRFNSRVIRLRWHSESRMWEALYADSSREKFFKVKVDYVAVCTGMYNNPSIPHYTGADTFAGTQLHAREFTDISVVRGRRLLIVGAGKTALDCVCTLAASRTAASVTMLYRQAHWPLPRTVLGLSIRRLLFNRATPAMLPPYYTAGRVERAVHAAARPLKRLFWKGLEGAITRRFRIAKDAKPPVGLSEDLFYGGPVLEDSYTEMLDKEGFASVRAGEINSFVRNGVILQDGSFLPVDVVLYCTGYAKTYDYFEGDIRAALGLQKDGLYLYRNCLPCEVPHLAFVGSEVGTYSSIVTHGLQALWLSRVLSGQVKLPSPADMAEDVRAQQYWRRKVMPAQHNRGAVLMLYGIHYHDQLLRDMAISPRRKGLNVFAECFGAYSPADYTDLMGCREGAADVGACAAAAYRLDLESKSTADFGAQLEAANAEAQGAAQHVGCCRSSKGALGAVEEGSSEAGRPTSAAAAPVPSAGVCRHALQCTACCACGTAETIAGSSSARSTPRRTSHPQTSDRTGGSGGAACHGLAPCNSRCAGPFGDGNNCAASASPRCVQCGSQGNGGLRSRTRSASMLAESQCPAVASGGACAAGAEDAHSAPGPRSAYVRRCASSKSNDRAHAVGSANGGGRDTGRAGDADAVGTSCSLACRTRAPPLSLGRSGHRGLSAMISPAAASGPYAAQSGNGTERARAVMAARHSHGRGATGCSVASSMRSSWTCASDAIGLGHRAEGSNASMRTSSDEQRTSNGASEYPATRRSYASVASDNEHGRMSGQTPSSYRCMGCSACSGPRRVQPDPAEGPEALSQRSSAAARAAAASAGFALAAMALAAFALAASGGGTDSSGASAAVAHKDGGGHVAVPCRQTTQHGLLRLPDRACRSCATGSAAPSGLVRPRSLGRPGDATPGQDAASAAVATACPLGSLHGSDSRAQAISMPCTSDPLWHAIPLTQANRACVALELTAAAEGEGRHDLGGEGDVASAGA